MDRGMLEKALELARNLRLTPANLERVSRQTSLEAARFAFLQNDLRSRATSRINGAHTLLFDRAGYEMATSSQIANYHASHFPSGELVVDLSCGLGFDAIAIGQRGPVLALEIDPDRAELARHNVAAFNLQNQVEIRVVDAETWIQTQEAESIKFAFADPARRAGLKRANTIDSFQPNPLKLSTYLASRSLGLMKLSPLIPDMDLIAFQSEIQFLSANGECAEALSIWRPQGISQISAVHVETRTRVSSGELPVSASAPSEYLIEVDSAAVRAHATGILAKDVPSLQLGDHPGWQTSSVIKPHPMLRFSRIKHHDRFDLNRLRAYLRDIGAGNLILKQRGAGLDLIKLAKQLRSEGIETTIAFWTVDSSIRWAHIEPAPFDFQPA